jgi:hypothetical protein
MNEEYHLLINGQQAGPYNLKQVRTMLEAGEVSAVTLYWTQGQTEWQPVSQLGLQQSVGGPPPVPSSQPPVYFAGGMGSVGGVGGMPAQPQTSGLAIWSMVLGFLVVLFSIFAAIPAVICGHISLGRINKSAGGLTGRGFAITGLVLGYLGLTIVPIAILAAIALPAFNAVQVRAKEMKSLNNEKMLALACRQYAIDNGGGFPPSLEALFPKYISERAVLVSPLMPGDADGYTYTPGLRDDDRSDTVLIEDKYGPAKHVKIVVHVDASAEVSRIPQDGG